MLTRTPWSWPSVGRHWLEVRKQEKESQSIYFPASFYALQSSVAKALVRQPLLVLFPASKDIGLDFHTLVISHKFIFVILLFKVNDIGLSFITLR